MSLSNKFKPPVTLKGFLQLCSKVTAKGKWDDVAGEIDKVLQLYLNGYSTSQNITILSVKLYMLLTVFSRIYVSDFGEYTSLIIDENINNVTASVVAMLPKVFGLCAFLQFMTSSSDWPMLHQTGSGRWSTQPFGGSNNSTSDLAKFLNDETHISGESALLERGFTASMLDGQEGRQLTSSLMIAKVRASSEKSVLQDIQCGLMFLATGNFHHSNLASAISFMFEFCNYILKDIYRNTSSHYDYYSRMKHACEPIPITIVKLISNGTKNQLEALYPDGYRDLYKDKLKKDAHSIEGYVMWLRQNIDGIIHSLERLKDDSKKWSTGLTASESSGPFVYGFIFGEAWHADSSPEHVSEAIDELIGVNGHLVRLRNILKGSQNARAIPAYTGATVGVATAAAAGASYSLYNNIFGVTDLVRSIFFR